MENIIEDYYGFDSFYFEGEQILVKDNKKGLKSLLMYLKILINVFP